MSTRGNYSFIDADSKFHIYAHSDNYPSGALNYINTWLTSGKSWNLPRWEADEAAAGFIAANKTCGGNFRLLNGKSIYSVAAPDAEYRYELQFKYGDLWVTAYSMESGWWNKPCKQNETKLFTGTLAEFKLWVNGQE